MRMMDAIAIRAYHLSSARVTYHGEASVKLAHAYYAHRVCLATFSPTLTRRFF